jgi:hypothetical protein
MVGRFEGSLGASCTLKVPYLPEFVNTTLSNESNSGRSDGPDDRATALRVTVIQHFLSFEDVEDALATLSIAALATLRQECVKSIARQTRIIAAIDDGAGG